MHADKRRWTCKRCGGHRRQVGGISQRGYCVKCAGEIQAQELRELHYKQGEYYARWRERIMAGVLSTPAP